MAKTNNAVDSEDKSEGGDAPLIDLNETSIKKLLARAKKRGVITYDELNEALPQDQMSTDQIEDVMAALDAATERLKEFGDEAAFQEQQRLREARDEAERQLAALMEGDAG